MSQELKDPGINPQPALLPTDPPMQNPLRSVRALWDLDLCGRIVSYNGGSYRLVASDHSDWQIVQHAYERCPVPNMEIAEIEIISNPDQENIFKTSIKKLINRQQYPAFQAKWRDKATWPNGTNEQFSRRQDYTQILQQFAAPYNDDNYPGVVQLTTWHGTKAEVIPAIGDVGLAALQTTDAGYFGKGVYTAVEAEYAFRVYAKDGGLIMTWVAGANILPVIDADNLEGQPMHSNHDTHFAPVFPFNPRDPNEQVYKSPKPGQQPVYHEVISGESGLCLPRYKVTLKFQMPRRINNPAETAAMLAHRAQERSEQRKKGYKDISLVTKGEDEQIAEKVSAEAQKLKEEAEETRQQAVLERQQAAQERQQAELLAEQVAQERQQVQIFAQQAQQQAAQERQQVQIFAQQTQQQIAQERKQAKQEKQQAIRLAQMTAEQTEKSNARKAQEEKDHEVEEFNRALQSRQQAHEIFALQTQVEQLQKYSGPAAGPQDLREEKLPHLAMPNLALLGYGGGRSSPLLFQPIPVNSANQPNINAAELLALFDSVAKGAWETVRETIKQDPILALTKGKGNFDDLSALRALRSGGNNSVKRIIPGISAFQYAVWSGDDRTVKIILESCAQNNALLAEVCAQYDAVRRGGACGQFGARYDIQPFIRVPAAIKGCNNSDEVKSIWREFGLEQRNAPAIIVNGFYYADSKNASSNLEGLLKRSVGKNRKKFGEDSAMYIDPKKPAEPVFAEAVPIIGTHKRIYLPRVEEDTKKLETFYEECHNQVDTLVQNARAALPSAVAH